MKMEVRVKGCQFLLDFEVNYSRGILDNKAWLYPSYFMLGVGTKIDPTLCRADRMVGQVLGAVGALPEIFTELEISYFLLRRLLGVRTEGDKKAAKVCALYNSCFWEG
jgi:hypothetical protein